MNLSKPSPRTSTLTAVLSALLLLPALAQEAPKASPQIEALKHLEFRNIGPTNQAGRVSVFVGVPGNRDIMYVSGANGGIFKTVNGGTTWKPIFDKQTVMSIGAIELAPSDPDILYVGTGEGNPRNNASFGNGVYRSNDGGETWKHIGLEDSDRIARIRIDNKNPDIAYACAMGHEWGPNEQRGVFKTTDGGGHWQRVLYKDNLTGCSDIEVNPSNSNEIYAGMFTLLRKAWHLRSGGGETALYKSMDGGATWSKLTNGIPAMLDRIGVAMSRSEPNIVYMVSETPNYEGELWRSDDSGATWHVVSKDPNIDFRPFYYADIRIDPADPNRVYALSGSLYMTEDAGKTFHTIGKDVHGDHQALWIDPTNAKRLLSGSDGGFQVSYDGGKNFTVLNSIAFTQFYHINYDMQKPYNVCGGLQDNGTWCGPSNSLLTEGIRKNDWFTVGGGDGFFAVPDLKEPWRVYNDLQGGSISVTDTRSGSSRNIIPYPNRVGSVGDAMEDHKYRFNWNSPIALAPDGQTVYFGGNVVFKSTNHGQSWDVISPDLTTNNKEKQKSSGEPIVTDNTAAEFHTTILTIAPSMLDPNIIWVGTDDGNVQVTRDGGKSWTNVVKNIPGLAPNAWIPTVEASHFDPGTAYVAADHHQDGDYSAYFYKTTDFGKTWSKVGLSVPGYTTGWSHVIREDPKVKSILYAGTELGLWISWDGGEQWTALRNGVPPVPVRDIQIQPRDNDLLVATHGRGLYIFDDITPLRRIGGVITSPSGVQLFDIRPATRWTMWGKDGNLGQGVWKAPNPPNGAIIDYYLKADQKEEPVITISDKSGNVIRTLTKSPKVAGVNRAVWDLRYDGAHPLINAKEDEENEYRFAGGPYVVPGEYVVKVRADGKEETKTVTVDMDPRVPTTEADLKAQLDTSLALRALMTKTNAAIDRSNSLVQQLTSLEERLKPKGSSQKGAKEPNSEQGKLLLKVNAALDAVKKVRDDELTRPYPNMGYRQRPRTSEEIRSVMGMVSRSTYRPTDGELLRTKELTSELEASEQKLNRIVSEDIAPINEQMKSAPYIDAGESIK